MCGGSRVALRPTATAGWDPEDPALQIAFTIRDFERIMLPQYEQQGCYLLEQEDAARILELQGIDVVDGSVRRPSLDDVFLSLTGHAALARPVPTRPHATRTEVE